MLRPISFEENQSSLGIQTAMKDLSLFDEEGRDYTFLFSYDQLFFSMKEIREDLAQQKLSVDPDEIDLEEV